MNLNKRHWPLMGPHHRAELFTGIIAAILIIVTGIFEAQARPQGQSNIGPEQTTALADLARSRRLAAQAMAELEGDNLERALLLAVEAGQAADTVEAFASLRQILAQPGRTLKILSGDIIAWNGAGTQLLITGTDNGGQIVDSETCAILFQLSSQTGPVRQAAWSPDDSRLLTGSDDGIVRVWEATTGRELFQMTGQTTDKTQAPKLGPGGRAHLDLSQRWRGPSGVSQFLGSARRGLANPRQVA